MYILRHYINAASIGATMSLGCLCLYIKADYDTFISEEVHQNVPYLLLILLGFARIFLHCIWVFVRDRNYLQFKNADMSTIFQNIHASAIVIIILIQIYLGVSELLNYEQIHDDVWVTMFHTGYEDHKRPWDELMKNFNCCGVYGSDKWDRFEFPCLEPGILKVGCPGLLVSYLIQITHFVAMSLLIISVYQLYYDSPLEIRTAAIVLIRKVLHHVIAIR